MDLVTIIVSALGGLLAIGGGLCAVLLPLGILGALGIFLYRRSQQGQAAKQAAQAWPETTGMVIMSTVQSRRIGRSNSIYPVVVYQYQVDGKTFQNQAIRAGDRYFNVRVMGQAQQTANRYPVGSQVAVYYNPMNPQDAVLER